MELTVEQFEMLNLRRSQEDMNTVVEILLNDGSLSVPADAPSVLSAKASQEAEREADKEAGGEGKTAFEKKVASDKAEREAVAKAQADAEKAAKAEAKSAGN